MSQKKERKTNGRMQEAVIVSPDIKNLAGWHVSSFHPSQTVQTSQFHLSTVIGQGGPRFGVVFGLHRD